MTNLSRRSILIGLPTLVALAAAAEEKRLALKGYDPVSYFTEGRPELGSAEYQAAFDDGTYWFKNSEHRAMFVPIPIIMRRSSAVIARSPCRAAQS